MQTVENQMLKRREEPLGAGKMLCSLMSLDPVYESKTSYRKKGCWEVWAMINFTRKVGIEGTPRRKGRGSYEM